MLPAGVLVVGQVLGSGFTVGLSADEAVQLTFDPGSDRHPDWSPDGSKIAFWSDRSGNCDIWVIPAAGGTPVQITTDPSADHRPDWSPDGSMIAFQSERSGNDDIWVIPATGGVATQITTDPAFDNGPAWSPDGSKIAFYSDRSGNFDIWVIPATGGTATQLTTHWRKDRYPTWSPDGTQIAFHSDRTGNVDIWVVPAEGGTPTPLTNEPSYDWYSDWSCDGNRIAFCSDRTFWGEVWVMTATGEWPTKVTEDPASDITPVWSPDGTQIAFKSVRSGNDDIWISDSGPGFPSQTYSCVGWQGLICDSTRVFVCPCGGGSQLHFSIRDQYDLPLEGVEVYATFETGCRICRCFVQAAVTDQNGEATLVPQMGLDVSDDPGCPIIRTTVKCMSIPVRWEGTEGGLCDTSLWLSADMDGDCFVKWKDSAILYSDMGTGACRSDFNCDGLVDDLDDIFLDAHLDHGCDSSVAIQQGPPAARGPGQPKPAYPNPTGASTRIAFSTARRGKAVISIYDLAGRRLRTITDEYRHAGEHEFVWDGRDDWGNSVPSGVYFCRLEVPGDTRIEKLIVLR
jgi:hypothetical protein